jgi:hypothetical protein
MPSVFIFGLFQNGGDIHNGVWCNFLNENLCFSHATGLIFGLID